MRILYFDTETYSAIDLTKIGSYLYTRHATTDIRCVSFCLVIDGARGPIETWTPGQPVPQTFIDVANDPDALVCAFNDAFDRQIQEQILARRYGWPVIPIARRRCVPSYHAPCRPPLMLLPLLWGSRPARAPRAWR